MLLTMSPKYAAGQTSFSPNKMPPTALPDKNRSLVCLTLRGFCVASALKVGPTTPKRLAGRIGELVAGHATLEAVATALLSVHAVLREFTSLEKRLCEVARSDARVRLLMPTPGARS